MNVLNNIKIFAKRAGMSVKKHSPEIMVITGVVGCVAAAVMACKATTKLDTVMDESRSKLDAVHNAIETESEEYSLEDSKKDTALIYLQTGVQLCKLYGPAVVLGCLSITSILASNDILRKRNAALAAAYATIDTSFKQYRERVIDRFGEEVERQIHHNIKAVEIEETVTDENGKEKKVKKTIDVVDPNEISDYAKIFDEFNDNWKKDPEYNLMFLKGVQAHCNDRLRAEGMLFLNDVYKELGFEPTKAGQVVGWVYDEHDPDCDNYVDFGIFNLHSQAAHDFVNGYERSILLDFNVDGNIWERML